MHSFTIIACLLASLVAANPVQTDRRSLGYGSSSASEQQQRTASASSTSYNTGGFGGSGGGGMSASSYSSSSSFSSVMNSFSSLGAQIGGIQSMMAGNSFSQTIASQEMSRLALSMQSALSQSVGCGCLGQSNIVSSASAVFSQFYSMMMSMQSTFGSSFANIVSPFGSLSSHFESFVQSIQSTGVKASIVFPSGLPSVMSCAVPTMPHLVGFK